MIIISGWRIRRLKWQEIDYIVNRLSSSSDIEFNQFSVKNLINKLEYLLADRGSLKTNK